jgi:hypothetical protein
MSIRDAQLAMQKGRKQLQAADREVNDLLRMVGKGAWAFTASAAEGSIRSDRSLEADHQALIAALQTTRADLAAALKAVDVLATKLNGRR